MSLGVADLRRIALGVSGLLVLVVLWGAGRVLSLSAPEPHLPTESSLRVAGLAGAAEEAPPPDFTTRPLFWYDRKPYEPPVQEVETVVQEEEVFEMEIDEVQLVGILGAGDQSGIIVTHAGDSLRLQLDEEVEGWRFVGLSEEGAEFTSMGRRRVLSMEHAAPRAPRGGKKDKPSGEKNASKADKKARNNTRSKKRDQREVSRKRESKGGNRFSGRVTSVWGGPPKTAEPDEKDAGDATDKAEKE